MAFPAVADCTLQLQTPSNPLLSWGEPFSQLDLPACAHAAKHRLGNERALGRVRLSTYLAPKAVGACQNELSLKLLLSGDSVKTARKEVKTIFFHIWALARGSV